MCWKYEHNNFQLWVYAIVYILLIGIQKSQILFSFISLNVSSDWNYHHQKGNYRVSMLTSCHSFFFWPEQQAYHKNDVLYMEHDSDKARNLIRLSNMLLTRCLLLYAFSLNLDMFFHLTRKLTILKTEWEFRFMYGHVLNIEYIEALKTSIVLSSYMHNMCSLVPVLAWDGLWVK